MDKVISVLKDLGAIDQDGCLTSLSQYMSRSSPHKTYFMETQQKRSWA